MRERTTTLYTPHTLWTCPGGRGYAEKLWNDVAGGYVISLSTGMTKVGRTGSVGRRLGTHFKNCENYGVTVTDVAVIDSDGDLLLLEQELKRYIHSHPKGDRDPWVMESAFGVPFVDILAFLNTGDLGNLWIPIQYEHTIS